MSKFLNKCRNQKTVSAHLVVDELEKQLRRYDELVKKHKELQHYSNKHKQLMQSEIKRLKGANRKLRDNA